MWYSVGNTLRWISWQGRPPFANLMSSSKYGAWVERYFCASVCRYCRATQKIAINKKSASSNHVLGAAAMARIRFHPGLQINAISLDDIQKAL